MLFCCGEDELSCVNNLQPEIDAFVNWTKLWTLRINTSKTTSMTFSKIVCQPFSLKIIGVPLVDKSEHKHLDVTIHCSLSWRCHL